MNYFGPQEGGQGNWSMALNSKTSKNPFNFNIDNSCPDVGGDIWGC